MTEKQALRARLRQMAAGLGEERRRSAAEKMAEHLFAWPPYRRAKTVFCFVGVKNEINTLPIIKRALAEGKRVCVPLCTGPGVMEARQITSLQQLRPGAFGIPEPDPAVCPPVAKAEMDLMLVPCTGAGQNGSRMGQGGGFYDRFLERRDDRAVLLCYSALAQAPALDTDPWDVDFAWLLTEEGMKACPHA